MGGENLADLHNRTREAADALRAQAAEIRKLTERLEEHTLEKGR